MKIPAQIDFFSDDFALAAAEAGLRARLHALAAGLAVVYVDNLDRYVKEFPDGRRFEIGLKPKAARESHIHILRELPAIDG